MTINFFFECFFFISAPSHSPSPFPLLPIVRFCKLASSSKRIPFNVAFLPPAQIVFTLRLQPVNVWFGSLTRKIFSWLEKNKRRDWIGTNRSKLMLPLRERFFSAAPKVGLKAFLLRMPMSINYSICRQQQKASLHSYGSCCATEPEQSLLQTTNVTLNSLKKKDRISSIWITSGSEENFSPDNNAHNDLIYSLSFSFHPFFPALLRAPSETREVEKFFFLFFFFLPI